MAAEQGPTGSEESPRGRVKPPIELMIVARCHKIERPSSKCILTLIIGITKVLF